MNKKKNLWRGRTADGGLNTGKSLPGNTFDEELDRIIEHMIDSS